MGDASNDFHRNLVRPSTEKLLMPKPGEKILDIACGNGNFSRRLAELEVKGTAIDFSANMIYNAVTRRKKYLDQIYFKICGATEYADMVTLGQQGCFERAVAKYGADGYSGYRAPFSVSGGSAEK